MEHTVATTNNPTTDNSPAVGGGSEYKKLICNATKNGLTRHQYKLQSLHYC